LVNVVFMGSPDFAVPVLKSLAQQTQYHIAGVITQPDKPAGRGRTLTPPPVKSAAIDLGLKVFQPSRLKAPEAFDVLLSWAPDLIVVAAYGQILRQNVLDLPRFGCINVHASLLPRWRGAAPIQAVLLHGDTRSGATIMKMDAGIDTGAVLTMEEYVISPEDTSTTLAANLSEIGARLLISTLPEYLSGKIQPVPQDESLASYAPMLKKGEGLLDFSTPAHFLVNKIRAYNPWPGAFTIWNGEFLKIHRGSAFAGSAKIGLRKVINGLPAVGTSDGWLVLEELQPAGRKAMSGKAFLQGAQKWSQT
jgi:methionyl-tRNA formyltransferase